MQLEILVEDASGKRMLEHLVPKIIGPKRDPHRYRIINIQDLKNRMMSKMPRHRAKSISWDDLLFETLKVQLRNYGNVFSPNKPLLVIVVVDVDYHDPEEFRTTLLGLLEDCDPVPRALFFLAVEEGEAWLLGDPQAIKSAYPFAADSILRDYEPDSICGTWEVLADAVYRGGSEKLSQIGYPEIGRMKFEWADRISPYVRIEENRSPSFQTFREGLKAAAGSQGIK